LPARAGGWDFASQAALKCFQKGVYFPLDFLGTLLVIQLALGVFGVPHQHNQDIRKCGASISRFTLTSELFAMSRRPQLHSFAFGWDRNVMKVIAG